MDEEQIKYTEVGDILEYDYDGDCRRPVVMCNCCWALVPLTYRDLHTEWHRKVGQ
jgi:hypothetical protein